MKIRKKIQEEYIIHNYIQKNVARNIENGNHYNSVLSTDYI